MLHKSASISRLMEMDFCSCFGFIKKPKRLLRRPASMSGSWFSRECLLKDSDLEESFLDNGEVTNTDLPSRGKSFEEILLLRTNNGTICREVPVKETFSVICAMDENGNKMLNEYVKECKIGAGNYGKVVLYRSNKDGKQYAIKVLLKSQLSKRVITGSETAMTDVLREVSINKMLFHPNIVNLVEVINDPNADELYMVLEYVEGKSMCNDSVCLERSTAKRYFRNLIAGLMYLHSHNIVHGDIKPTNILVTSSDTVKIIDFGVSQVFEDDNDELRRSPGTTVFTAPECCSGLTYHGKASDTWALGVTLYFMVLGQYPFLGETPCDTYDKIVNKPLSIPDEMDPELKDLLQGILCKEPEHRLTLEAVAGHPWVMDEEGPIQQYSCFCQRNIVNLPASESLTASK